MAVRVLVVDDAEPMRVLTQRLLTPAETGYEVVAAVGSRDAAVAAFAEAGPDLVLLDVNLGGDDGFDVAAAILATDPSARIVLLTGDAAPDVERAATSAGLVGVVSKGELHHLVERLRALG